MKINDVDRKRSNDVLATLVMMFCPYGHKHKKERPFYQNSRSFLVEARIVELLSENLPITASTGLVYGFRFPFKSTTNKTFSRVAS